MFCVYVAIQFREVVLHWHCLYELMRFTCEHGRVFRSSGKNGSCSESMQQSPRQAAQHRPEPRGGTRPGFCMLCRVCVAFQEKAATCKKTAKELHDLATSMQSMLMFGSQVLCRNTETCLVLQVATIKDGIKKILNATNDAFMLYKECKAIEKGPGTS